MRDKELEHLTKLKEALNDNSVGTNPLFEHIDTCEYLKRYCQNKIKSKSGGDNQETAQKEEDSKQSTSTEINKAIAKGSIQLAPSKEEKLASNVFNTLVSKKSKKTNKKNQDQTN